jgi:AcrR family transcriptional regulator
VTTSQPPARQARRSDARRNAERLVVAATAAFAEHGPEASLIDIARTAGLGSATLYRHFPSREALLAAVYQSEVEALAAQAYDLLREAPSPMEALVAWLRAFVTHLITYRGLKGLLTSTYDDRGKLFASCRQALYLAATALLTTAQGSGAVRRDVDVYQTLKLVSALVIATEHADDPVEATGHLLDLVIDGLRHHPPATA